MPILLRNSSNSVSYLRSKINKLDAVSVSVIVSQRLMRTACLAS